MERASQMTVLRKSKCAWCHPEIELLTWWERFLDSQWAENWFWRMPFIPLYLRITGKLAPYSKKWHRLFHGDSNYTLD